MMEIPLDKLLHASLSANLQLGLTALLALVLDPDPALFFGAMLAVAIGAAKELIHDRFLGRGTPELLDMAANLLGVGAGVVTTLLLRGEF